MRDRLLVRHFLQRFLEHDLISSTADRREVVAVVGGALIALTLFTSVLIAWVYQLDPFRPPGLTSVGSLDDRFLFVSASMLVMALLAVSQWDALSLDARDTAVLGILPIPKAVIIRAKFLAVALLAAGTLVACTLAPTLFRFASVPAGLRIGGQAALILTIAHALVTLAAGVFGFLAVYGLREGLVAVLGQGRFHAISSMLQAVLLIVLTSALLLLPGSSINVASRWFGGEPRAKQALPQVWFVGLHETLAGRVIDDLPRTQPKRFLVVRERDATNLYRSLWPLYRRLGRVAIEALAGVILITIAACAWNSRRLPAAGIRRRRQAHAVNLAAQWVVGHVVARSRMCEAGFWFTLQTLPRRLNHRVALASALAVGFSLIVVTAGDRMMMIHSDVATIPLTILAAQALLITSVLTGFRHAVQVPSELRAGRTFSLVWTGDARSYVSGVKRAGFIGLALPVLIILSVWHAALLPLRVVFLHFAVGAAYSIFLIEVLFLRYRRVPFVSAYQPAVEIKSHGVVYIVVMLLLSFVLAGTERLAFLTIVRYATLIGAIGGLTVAVAAFDRARLEAPPILGLDEQPALPTQRLGLLE
ncbi:MAG TPA: hypothetical protein VF456_09605 [Vicinamibacterales bacterium]